MGPSKGIANLAHLKVMFIWLFCFEKIEFTTNGKSSMQVSPWTTAMQKLYASFMHSSVLCHLLICHHSINASNKSSKYRNYISTYETSGCLTSRKIWWAVQIGSFWPKNVFYRSERTKSEPHGNKFWVFSKSEMNVRKRA